MIGIQEKDDQIDDVLSSFQHKNKFNQKTGRYIVRLPWKKVPHTIPSNFSLCKKRLNNLCKSLQKKSKETIKQYDLHIQHQLQRGFIEEVQTFHMPNGVLHYIAHFPVLKDSSTTKMRIVYDASAKMNQQTVSLNDCLYTGSNLLQDLTGVLLKFRVHQIAITADIEKAFLQIELDTRERDATRFLFLKNIEKPVTMDDLRVYQFCRVLFGAAPSPFLLLATVHYHLDINARKSACIARDLKECMYMDNVVTGVSDEKQAMHYYIHSRELMDTAGMNLRQWCTNSKVLKQKNRRRW